MSDEVVKISLPNRSVNSTSTQDMALDSRYIGLKCDLRPSPKHYGVINCTIASIGAYPTSITIYQIAHGYPYIPSFITAWNYPPGTDSLPGNAGNATFGIGDMDATLNNGIVVSMYTDANNFNIVASNTSSNVVTNFSITVRFYIFADDFPLYTGL